MPWYAVYTKPRWEKKVAAGLLARGLESYLPLNKTLRQWSDRKKWVELPLIPSYVFVYVNPEQEERVRRIDGILNFVYWLGKKAAIPEAEIQTLQDFVNRHSNIQLERMEYSLGDLVSFEAGIFKGQEAIVVAVKEKRLELVLKQLGMKLVVST